MSRFTNATPVSWYQTFAGAVRAARTVIWTPAHKERVIHDTVAQSLALHKQPLEKPIDEVIKEIDAILSNLPPIEWTSINAKERLGLFAALMQFTMYLPTIQPYFREDYSKVTVLYKSIVKHGSKTPTDLSTQLSTAVHITGNVPDALWLLLTTCRQYARWYDGEAFTDMPTIPKAEAEDLMRTWSTSITAIKPWSASYPQDSSGDTYYVWTHAIAKILYGPMSPWWALDAYLYKCALHVGTWLNHSIAHKVSPQSIDSDHTLASQYGNAIGKRIAEHTWLKNS